MAAPGSAIRSGTIGAGLIVWLALLGIRKRAMTRGRWSLKAWTSAHVYLGLALIVIGTLHTGFQFGWNVHTLAWVLMMLVIVSGIYGISVYAMLPQGLRDSRSEMTGPQMIEAVRQPRQADPASPPSRCPTRTARSCSARSARIRSAAAPGGG